MTQPDPETLLDDVDFDFSGIDEVEEIDEAEEPEEKIACIKPKQQLVNFLIQVKMEEHYKFTYPGTKKQAVKYIHTMRVELSRFRDRVRKLGKKNILFKVRIVSIVPIPFPVDPKTGITPASFHEITLVRTQKALIPTETMDTSVIDALTNHNETK